MRSSNPVKEEIKWLGETREFHFRFSMQITRSVTIYDRAEYTVLQMIGDITAMYEGTVYIGHFFMFFILYYRNLKEVEIIKNTFKE